MEENKLDQYFKDNLSAHSEAPSPQVWDRIDAALTPEDEILAPPLLWRSVALISLALLLLVSGVFCWRMHRLEQEKLQLETALAGERSSLENEKLTEAQQGFKPEEQKKKTGGNEAASFTPAVKDEYYLAPTETASEPIDKRRSVTVKDYSGPSNTQGSAVGYTQRPDLSEPVIISHNSQGNGNYEESQDIFMDLEREGLSEMEDMALQGIRLHSNQIKQQLDSSGWTPYWPTCAGVKGGDFSRLSAGLTLFQNQSFRRISPQNAEGRQQRSSLNRAEKPATSPGLRGYLSYALNRHWSLGLGVEYAQWKQSGNYALPYSGSDGQVSTSPMSNTWSYNTDLLSSTGVDQVLLQTELSDAAASPWEGFNGGESDYVQVNIEERIDWLSIPLSLHYQTWPGRWGLRTGVGLSYDILLSNHVESQIDDRFSTTDLKSSGFDRSGYISAHAEAGLVYRLSEGSLLHLGPRFKSWLIPLHDNALIRSYPYSTAIEIGVEVKL